jgi:hypothetical protein
LGVAPRRDIAEEAQGVRLVAPFLVCTGDRQGTFGKGLRFLQPTRQHLCLPQGEGAERLKGFRFRRSRLFHRLREQRHGLGEAPAQCICGPQRRSHPGEPGPEARFLTTTYGLFEWGERSGQVALAEGQ